MATWQQIGFANGQTNARGRASASGKARRMLDDLLGPDHDPNLPLSHYYQHLDQTLWPDQDTWHEGNFRRSADAEQAKATGGMVALYPRVADGQKLVVPGGEPLAELHCTVIYLGEDVRSQDPTELIDYLHYVSGNYRPIDAKIFGSAVFNSSGPDPCVVYLVGGNPDLSSLFQTLKQYVTERYPGSAEQHDPWIPHITAAYNAGVGMDYEGPVLFDRIGLRWPGADQDFIL